LGEKGYDERLGARPLKRAIVKYIEDPISEEILNDRIEDKILVDWDSQMKKITVNGSPIEESKRFVKKWDKFKLF
jgi:ATP-dependent Clp protease ATP-binding subunit ClpC